MGSERGLWIGLEVRRRWGRKSLGDTTDTEVELVDAGPLSMRDWKGAE